MVHTESIKGDQWWPCRTWSAVLWVSSKVEEALSSLKYACRYGPAGAYTRHLNILLWMSTVLLLELQRQTERCAAHGGAVEDLILLCHGCLTLPCDCHDRAKTSDTSDHES